MGFWDKIPESVFEDYNISSLPNMLLRDADLEKRVMLFLFARLMNKSNRDVEELLELFEPLFGIKVSYKTVERLYSDEEVMMVLHNLFILLLEEEGVSGDKRRFGWVVRQRREDRKEVACLLLVCCTIFLR